MTRIVVQRGTSSSSSSSSSNSSSSSSSSANSPLIQGRQTPPDDGSGGENEGFPSPPGGKEPPCLAECVPVSTADDRKLEHESSEFGEGPSSQPLPYPPSPPVRVSPPHPLPLQPAVAFRPAPNQDSSYSRRAEKSPTTTTTMLPPPPPILTRRRIPRPSSPRTVEDGDGYNSADEQNPWPAAFGDNEEERERQFESNIMRMKGLEVHHMTADGNCLFRAVADQVYGDVEMHGEARQLCIDYMEKERDHFAQFVTESLMAYCKRKRKDKVYGNNLEIQAMAEMYNRPIHIYYYSTEPINIFQGGYETDLPPIRLSYHCNNHYNSLVDPCKPTVGAGLGFGSLRGRNVDGVQVKAAIKAQQDQLLDKALLAEGQYYSDLELLEQEMQRTVMEASRAEFLAQEETKQRAWLESTSTTAPEPSSSAHSGTSTSQDVIELPQACIRTRPSHLFPGSSAEFMLTTNMRMLLTMGFSYLRVLEANDIFGDDVNDMLCYLLEVDASVSMEDSIYRLKGKATEK